MSRPTSEKVVVGYLSPGMVHSAFHESLMDVLLFDMTHHRRIVNKGGRLHILAGANLSDPRNRMVRKFLEYGQADWLWIVDSDMTFTPDLVERLLEFADPDTAPIVGALCFGFDDKADIQPTLFSLMGEQDRPEFIRYSEWPPNSMFQVGATGTGCLLVHKSVFERMRDVVHPSRGGKRGFNDAFPWFQETEHQGAPVGEDITFCLRAGQLDIPVYVNTGVQCGHMKERELTMDLYFAQLGTRRGDDTFGAAFKEAEMAK